MAGEKLGAYLLQPEHPLGGPKARALARFLGYGPGDAPRLRAELLEVVRSMPVWAQRPGYSGAVKYEVAGVIGGPNGRRAPVLTIWQVDAPGESPRLVTAYLTGGPLPEEPLQSGP